jgi:hypothetical protein
MTKIERKRELRSKIPARASAQNLVLLTVLAFILLPAGLVANQAKPLADLEGKLQTVEGKGPILKVHGKEQLLSATTPYLLHTLEDKRLANREVRVEGLPKPDGTFEVQWLYTIHNGKLFRVRYYCSVCNIEALEPGNCVCCQQPTELQEIPADQANK